MTPRTSPEMGGRPRWRIGWRLPSAAAVVIAMAMTPLLYQTVNPDRAPADAGPAPPGRAATFAYCPELELTALPPGFAKIDSQLTALPGGNMGKVVTYTNGRQRIKTFSGVDAIDAVEDVELTSHAVEAAGRQFMLHETVVFPGLLLAALKEEEEDGEAAEEPCDEVFVQSTQLSTSELIKVLAGLKVHATEASTEGR